MAEMHYTHNMGYVGTHGQATQGEPQANNLKMLTNAAGAVLSLALLAGVAVWSYQLIMRDVSGIPVVRAAEGEMRVRPSDPGGQLAQNTGLAVNEVAASGAAAGPSDRLLLAPQPTDLAEEDVPLAPATVAPVQQPAPIDVAASLDAPVSDTAAIDALVSKLVAGAEPIEAVATDTAAPLAPVVTLAATPTPQATEAPTPAVFTGPGLQSSLRPVLRSGNAPAVVVPARSVAAPTSREMDGATLPAGTRLVQLGAFDSADVARSEWDKISTRYGDFFTDKDRVIQKAQSGGRTFYRLRAHGFADLSDARRFCSALVAEGTDCIPVVTR